MLIAVLPLVLSLVCCISASLSLDSGSIDSASLAREAELLSEIGAFDRADIEAVAIESRGDVVDVGFLLQTVQIDRIDDRQTSFRAVLVNLGAFLVRNPLVTLRLTDADGDPVETVDMTNTREILGPGEQDFLKGSTRSTTRLPASLSRRSIGDPTNPLG